MKQHLHSLKAFFERYEEPLLWGFFVIGFVWDNIFVTRPDVIRDHILLSFYFFVGGATIIILNLHEARRLKTERMQKYATYLPFVLQFVFGGMFNVYVILYTRSGSIIGSWPFLLVLVAVLFGNEYLRKRYERFAFRVSIYFTAILSYMIFLVPVLIHRMGDLVFIGSGLVSLVFIGIFFYIAAFFVPGQLQQAKKILFVSIGGIYLAFNIFYFTNLIPPLPLALKESGIYHKITPNVGGGYTVSAEPAPWYLPWRETSLTYHRYANEPVYFFSAVFAPTKLNVKILHRWSYYNAQQQKWVTAALLEYPIAGGRDGGYRGYSMKSSVGPGKWRVDVITERGQILGRTSFTVVQSDTNPGVRIGVK